MSENAGSQPAAPDREPTGPPPATPQTPELRYSDGNGVLHQILTFIKDMSGGDRTQKCIAVGVLLVLALALVIVLTTRGAIPWVGGATGITGASVGITKFVGRQRKADSGK